MKYILFSFLIIILINCSSVKIIKNEFDNSTFVMLTQNFQDYVQKSGRIKLNEIIFSKEFKDGQVSIPRLFCKFKGYNGEYLEGNFIELKVDDTIYKLILDESRLAKYEKISSSAYTLFTRIGAFTFYDGSGRRNVNILAMETTLSEEIQDAILVSKKFMLRVYTKDTNGISQNIFLNEYTVDDIKKFIKTVPKK